MKKLLKQNLGKILVAVFLLLGIGVGVYITQNPQIFKSRASSKPADNLKVIDSSGENIQKLNTDEAAEFGGNENIPVFRIKGSTFTVRDSR